MSGRKITSENENPIDDVLISICDSLIDICMYFKITPNMITLSRIVIGTFVFYYLYYTNEHFYTIIGTIVFYLLDILDGHLARSTNQVTILGDYLDHFADVGFFFIIVFFILFNKFPNKTNIIILLIVMLYLSMVHLSLQQVKYKQTDPKAEVELLDGLLMLHNLECHHICWTRYFGTGTLYTLIVYIIYYIQNNKKK